jgi:hypothetical protein
VASSVWLYATVSAAPGNDPVVMVNSGGAFTVNWMAWPEELPAASFT